ncbi:MAG: putative quinol monooxygenase [Burkholderiaceae bacterium]
MPKVILSGYIEVPDADLEAVLAELPRHIDLTRQEPGCLVFEVSRHEANGNRFDVYEAFEDTGAFEAHQVRMRNSPWASVTANAQRHYQVTHGDTQEPRT